MLTFAIYTASQRRREAVRSLNELKASLSTIYFSISVSHPTSDSEQKAALLSLSQMFHLLTFFVRDRHRIEENKDASEEQESIKRHLYH